MDQPNRFDFIKIFLVYFLPIVGFLGILIPFIIGFSNYAILGSYLGIPMILSPLIFKKTENYKFNPPVTLEKYSKVFLIFFILIYIIAIIIIYNFSLRTIDYYLAVTLLCLVIVGEIFYLNLDKKMSVIILMQIICVALVLVWGVNLKYYLFIGRTDPLAHMWFIQNLISDGYVTEVFEEYVAFPLWHILVAICSEFFIIYPNTFKVMFIINGFVYSMLLLTLYIIVYKIFKINGISLLAVLFLSLNPDFLFMGMTSIARSVEIFLFILLIFILIQNLKYSTNILVLIVFMAIVIYHPVSVPFIFSILLLILVSQRLLGNINEKLIISINKILLLSSITLGYWIYQSVFVFQTAITHLIMKTPEGFTNQIVQLSTPFNEVFNYLQYSPLLFFTILGFLFIAGNEKFESLPKVLSLTGLLLTAVAFPGPSLLINKLAEDLNIGRFGEYAFPFISIAASAGLFMVFFRLKKKSRYLIIILFSLMCLLAISNDFVASDNPLMKRSFYTYYLTEEETWGINHVTNMTAGYLMSDYVTDRYISFSKYKNKAHILETDTNKSIILQNSKDDVFLIRQGELKKRPLKVYISLLDRFIIDPPGDILSYVNHDATLWSSEKSQNLIYDSNNLIALTQSN